MDSQQAFIAFVTGVLLSPRARRFSTLAGNAKGQRKILAAFYHDFERAIKPNAKRVNVDRRAACYAYHSPLGFDVMFAAVNDALDRLGSGDGWLIVLTDGSAGIYRPEAAWNRTVEIGA
jgi:hypothetical protein